MTISEPIPQFNEFTHLDVFELPRQDAEYQIHYSANETENPALVKRARQIHGMSYVEYGYFNEQSLAEDGSLVDELDGTRGTQDGRRTASYLVASRYDTDLSDGTASVRLLNIGERGNISDLPTYKYFADVFDNDAREKLSHIVQAHGKQGIREVAALSTTDAHEHRGSFELMRALVQNSMVKHDAHHTELYLASLTNKSLQPVLRFIHPRSAAILAKPVQILSEDERSQSIYVTPVLMDLNAVVKNFMDDISRTSHPKETAALEHHLHFLLDGLPENLFDRYINS